MTEWISPIDGHMHYALKNRAECAVCILQDERDELKTDNDEYSELLDRLSKLLTNTANALKGAPGPLILHDWSDLPAVAKTLTAERDRFREALALIAIPPSPHMRHDQEAFFGCTGCAHTAQLALGGSADA